MQLLRNFIDISYPPFRKLMPLQTFRYAACGGTNTLLGLTVYFIAFHYLFSKENADFGLIVLKPHNAALFFAGICTFITGFLLNKFVVFTSSNLRGHIQLFRYFLSFFINLIINYFLLKLFVEILHLEPFLSQVITTAIIITISFFTQKHFTFKIKAEWLSVYLKPMKLFFLYIDPSSGSYLVQMLIAAILGSLFFFKNAWLRVKNFITGKKHIKEDDPENEL